MKTAVICLFLVANIAYVLSGGDSHSSSSEFPVSSSSSRSHENEESSKASPSPSQSPSPSPSLPRNPCGTIVYYNPKKNPSAPVGVSVNAGRYNDNTFSYVGLGNSTCTNEPVVPARLAVALTSGPYVTCGKAQINNNGGAYVENHPNMRWVAADAATQADIPGVVKYKGEHFTYLFGRVNITFKGKTYQDVSKVHIGDKGSVAGLVYIPAPGASEAVITSGYEVLVCVS